MQLARSVIEDANAPIELKLMSFVVLDCHAVFLVHAPVIAAIKHCIDRHGNVPRDYQERFQRELVPAVRALHRFDATIDRGGAG